MIFGPSLRPSSPGPVRYVISPLATLGIIGMVVGCGMFAAWVIIDS
jgi:hypothetical protein